MPLSYTIADWSGIRYINYWDPYPLIQDGLIHTVAFDLTGAGLYDEIICSFDLSGYTDDEVVPINFAVYDLTHGLWTNYGSSIDPSILVYGVSDAAWNPYNTNLYPSDYLQGIANKNYSTGSKWSRFLDTAVVAGVGAPNPDSKSMTRLFYVVISRGNNSRTPGLLQFSYRIPKKLTRIAPAMITPGTASTVSIQNTEWIRDTQLIRNGYVTSTKYDSPFDGTTTFSVPASSFPEGDGLYQVWAEIRLTRLYARFNSWDIPATTSTFATDQNPVAGEFAQRVSTLDSYIKALGGVAVNAGTFTGAHATALQTYYGYSLIYGGTSHKCTIASIPNNGEGLGIVAAQYAASSIQAIMVRNDAGSDTIQIVFESVSTANRTLKQSWNIPGGVLAAGTKLYVITRPKTFNSDRSITSFTMEVFYDTGAGAVFVGEYTSDSSFQTINGTAYNNSGIVIKSGSLDDFGVQTLTAASRPVATSWVLSARRNGLPLGPPVDFGGSYFGTATPTYDTPIWVQFTFDSGYISNQYDANYGGANAPAYVPVKAGDTIDFSVMQYSSSVDAARGGDPQNTDPRYYNGTNIEIRSIKVAKQPAQAGQTVPLAYVHNLPLGAPDTDQTGGGLSVGDLWVPQDGHTEYWSSDSKDICITSNGDVYAVWIQRTYTGVTYSSPVSYSICMAMWNGSVWTLISNDVWGRGFATQTNRVEAVSCDTDGTNVWVAWGENDGTNTSAGASYKNQHVRMAKYMPGSGITRYDGVRRFSPADPGAYTEIAGYAEGLILKCSPAGVPWVATVQADKAADGSVNNQWEYAPCVWYYSGSGTVFTAAHPPRPVNPWNSHPDYVAPTYWNGTSSVPTPNGRWGFELNEINIDVQRQVDLTFCHHDGPSEYPSLIGQAFFRNWNPNIATAGTYPAYADSRIQADLGYTYYTFLYTQCRSDHTWKAPNGTDDYLHFTSDKVWGSSLQSDILNTDQSTRLGDSDMDTNANHLYGYGHWQQGLSLVNDGVTPILVAPIGVHNWSDSVQSCKITLAGPVSTSKGDGKHRALDAVAYTWTDPTIDAVEDATGQIYILHDNFNNQQSTLTIPALQAGNASIPASKNHAMGAPYGDAVGLSRMAVRGDSLYMFRNIASTANGKSRNAVFKVDLRVGTYTTLTVSSGVTYTYVSLRGVRWPQRTDGARHTIAGVV